jgi:hypothetical protein
VSTVRSGVSTVRGGVSTVRRGVSTSRQLLNPYAYYVQSRLIG